MNRLAARKVLLFLMAVMFIMVGGPAIPDTFAAQGGQAAQPKAAVAAAAISVAPGEGQTASIDALVRDDLGLSGPRIKRYTLTIALSKHDGLTRLIVPAGQQTPDNPNVVTMSLLLDTRPSDPGDTWLLIPVGPVVAGALTVRLERDPTASEGDSAVINAYVETVGR